MILTQDELVELKSIHKMLMIAYGECRTSERYNEICDFWLKDNPEDKELLDKSKIAFANCWD